MPAEEIMAISEAVSAESICARLSAEVVDLHLPHGLTCRAQEVSVEEKTAYLSGLFHRDAAVFLERYGRQLHGTELGPFEAMGDNYEVAWHLRDLKSSRDPSPGKVKGKATTVKNRRFAHMRRLLQEGTYFSDDSMRLRAPLLHHQYLGQFEDPAERNMVRPGERYSDTLARQSLEVEFQRRLREERIQAGEVVTDEEEEREESDSETSNMEEDDDEEGSDEMEREEGRSDDNERRRDNGLEEAVNQSRDGAGGAKESDDSEGAARSFQGARQCQAGGGRLWGVDWKQSNTNGNAQVTEGGATGRLPTRGETKGPIEEEESKAERRGDGKGEGAAALEEQAGTGKGTSFEGERASTDERNSEGGTEGTGDVPGQSATEPGQAMGLKGIQANPEAGLGECLREPGGTFRQGNTSELREGAEGGTGAVGVGADVVKNGCDPTDIPSHSSCAGGEGRGEGEGQQGTGATAEVALGQGWTVGGRRGEETKGGRGNGRSDVGEIRENGGGPAGSFATQREDEGEEPRQVRGRGKMRVVRPSAEEMEEREEEFLRVMQEKFLSGEDEGHVDYVRIDADATLDDDWLVVMGHDAEDKYFDED
eukprot:TRINITY_DN6158_c0_g1_i1.p1 TRINITY_DN6158_c0_g1~~TRINITY_DN6158_c0_g1_i1.p1  ORF type:complete len:595 (-),score=174.04 TRINITY_DN6158_c0_g1_i1:250-2034(-)